MTKYSILIVGCGGIGERHLRCFLQSARVNEVVACDTNPVVRDRIASAYAVPVVGTWQEAVAKTRISAAVICTPAPFHVSLGVTLLKAGIHVLIEKPLSHALNDVDLLVSVRDQSGLKASVAYVYNVIPTLVAARDFLKEQSLGNVLHATARAGQPFHLIRPDYPKNYYRDRKTGGGAIQDALTHLANWMESVLGPTNSVYCDCSHLALPDVTVEDTVHITARNGSAMVGYFLNQFQAPNETTLQFDTARGSVMIELHRQRWGIFRTGDADWTWNYSPVKDGDVHFVAQANAFLDYIEGSAQSACSLESAIQTLRFNLAALSSAESGIRVECSSLHA